MLEFGPRAETARRPGMLAGLTGLMGGAGLDPEQVRAWLPDWRLAFEAAAEKERVDSRIHTARLNYYEKAIRAMLEGETPAAALWPLLQTWTLAVEVLPNHAVDAWRSACGQLGFTTSGFEERLQGLDQFLDDVEELLDELARENGLETSTSI
jgi:hypothetical protein